MGSLTRSPAHPHTPARVYQRPLALVVAGVAATACLAACAAGLWLARLLSFNNATLVALGQPAVTSYDCLVGGRFIRPGPAVNVNTEWLIDDDVVPVMADLRRQGWQSSTHMATNVEMQMLPTRPTVMDMGFLRVQVFRALALSYSQSGGTRIVATTRIVACPP